jgi:hypothetical protein
MQAGVRAGLSVAMRTSSPPESRSESKPLWRRALVQRRHIRSPITSARFWLIALSQMSKACTWTCRSCRPCVTSTALTQPDEAGDLAVLGPLLA